MGGIVRVGIVRFYVVSALSIWVLSALHSCRFSRVGLIHKVVKWLILATLVLLKKNVSLSHLLLELLFRFRNHLLFLLEFTKLLDGVTHTVAHLNEVGDVAACQHF